MTDEELRCAFEGGMVPEGGFHHEQHVRVGWGYLREYALPEALHRFTTSLRHFAAAQGKPDLYHETITIAFMLIIAERAQTGVRESWVDFVARNADLLTWKPSVLDRYYTPEMLWSERARRQFVMPDRCKPS